MKKLFVIFVALFTHPMFAIGGEAPRDLIGGVPAAPGDWPEIVYITNGSARCSASFVGESVILTAGHCSPDKGRIRQVSFRIEGVSFSALCEQAPPYRDHTEDLDMSLCKTDKPVVLKYASIAKVAPKVGDPILLSGYGCTSASGGGNDGILRTGLASLTTLPSGTFNWFVTVGKSAACFGDSGSAALVKVLVPKQEKHVILGVNSRGNIDDTSFLTALWMPKAQKFLKDFAATHKLDICGVTKECNKKGE